jgi:predicted lipid-binding transport protein (Tim44 family)
VSVVPSRLPHCLSLALVSLLAAPAFAQDAVYRCGNEYINNAAIAKQRGCTPLQGGNITVIEGTRPNPPAAGASPAPRSSSGSSASSAPRIDNAAQRARDSDARQILESELRRAEERLSEAQKAYANGEPEKQGIEGRNHQRYLDRVADLKAALGRAESDVAGIRRELQRLGPTASN